MKELSIQMFCTLVCCIGMIITLAHQHDSIVKGHDREITFFGDLFPGV